MKIDELIEVLEKEKEKHGNVEVHVALDGCGQNIGSLLPDYYEEENYICFDDEYAIKRRKERLEEKKKN